MGFVRQAVVVLILAYVITKIPTWLQPKLEPRVEGYFHPDFRKVAEAFRRNVERGEEKGASLSFVYKGEPLIDLWGGFADPESGRHWQNNTLTLIYSATKGVTALVVAQFVDRGLLDYKKLVSSYWPKFGQNGKDNISLEILISHQGGLAETNGTIPMIWMLREPDKVDEFLEKQKPTWPPGTQIGYHGITYGMYLDRLLQKVDPKHRTVDQIWREDIAEPFDIDLYNGLPYSEVYRTARQVPLAFTRMAWDFATAMDWTYIKLLYNFFRPKGVISALVNSGFDQVPATGTSLNDPDMTQIPMSSMMGFGNARSLAKLFGIIAVGGTYKGKQLVSKKSLDLLRDFYVEKGGIYGLLSGMGLGVFRFPTGKGNVVLGTIGAGGQVAYADFDRHVGYGYVTSHGGSFGFNDDPKVLEYQKLFYECLEDHMRKKT